VVIEQIDLIYIENAAVGGGQNARFKVALTALDGLFDVERADHAVFCGAHGEIDKGSGTVFNGQLALLSQACAAVITEEIGASWVTAKRAPLHNLKAR
jgi:hypothetical protein